MSTMKSPDTRRAILDAAVTVYGRAGVPGFSMRAVAAEAGITATAIYRHYPDKQALALALVERAREMLGSCLLEGVRGSDSLERLWSCGEGYIRFAREHPQLYRLLFLDPLQDSLPDARVIHDHDDAVPYRFVIDRIREAMADGRLRPDDPARVGLSVWAHLHGVCALSLAGRVRSEDLPAVARMSLRHLLDGLAKEVPR